MTGKEDSRDERAWARRMVFEFNPSVQHIFIPRFLAAAVPQASCTILTRQTWLKGDMKLKGRDSEPIKSKHTMSGHTHTASGHCDHADWEEEGGQMFGKA